MKLVTEKVCGNSRDKGARLHFTTKQACLRLTKWILLLRNYFRCKASLFPANRLYGKEVLLVSCCAVCIECTVYTIILRIKSSSILK